MTEKRDEKLVMFGDLPLLPSEYEICSGWIGSMGKLYSTATALTITESVQAAAEISGCSELEIAKKLVAGQRIVWHIVNDDYHHNSQGFIRQKRSAKPVTMVECDCGHSVPKGQRMTANLGTSCPDCYDRMS